MSRERGEKMCVTARAGAGVEGAGGTREGVSVRVKSVVAQAGAGEADGEGERVRVMVLMGEVGLRSVGGGWVGCAERVGRLVDS